MPAVLNRTQPGHHQPFDTGLNEFHTATFFGISVETVRKWRQHGTGPRYRKLGKSVRYSVDDLRAFWDSLPTGGARA